MQQRRHYSRAPIVEAVIDVRVRLPEAVTLATLTEIQSGEEAGYPERRDSYFVEGEMRAGPQVAAAARQTHIGYVFTSVDGHQIFQARLNGFTFSRLAPYDRWESFQGEARRLWDVYRSVTHPDAITRLAVRYVNRLDLPLPINDFKDYLRTVPEISPSLPQGLSGYIMRLQIPQDDLQAELILNEALVPSARSDVVSVLLDIDVFRVFDESVGEENLWRCLEGLHTRETEVFEACITDETREVIA